ncbi:CRISPR-associated helicase/endonuclease Cas3 [Lactobacillus selangorensis]|nr:CRISPR-associated helicase/endonuclease Cas3 [Lactobacillus selangorensis]
MTKFTYFAKSSMPDGTQKTIAAHTNDLIQQYQLLKKHYPKAMSEEAWLLLEYACVDHDLGKMNLKFQKKLKNHQHMLPGEMPHAILSITLLPTQELATKFPKKDVAALVKAVAYHHYRDMSNIEKIDYRNEIKALKDPAANFPFDQIHSNVKLKESTSLRPLSPAYFNLKSKARNDHPETLNYPLYVLLKGLLNRIDYAASGGYEVELPNDGFLQKDLQEHTLATWQKKNPHAHWNQMQKYAQTHANGSLLIRAQTGMGKTEAALLWAGDDKTFFTLPLKIAIDSIYDRIQSEVVQETPRLDKQGKQLPSNLVGKLDSDFDDFMVQVSQKLNPTDTRLFGNELKNWSLPLTVTTLDQVFNFTFHYINYEQKLATLGYSKIIIDEIQMYDSQLLGYILYGLQQIVQMGGKFLVMTATMPPFICDLMKNQGLQFDLPPAFLNENLPVRHNMKIIKQQIRAAEIVEQYHDNKVLVIVNKVKTAMTLFEQLQEEVDDPGEVHLIHSRFIHRDRVAKQNEILKFGNKNTKGHGIWIGTQILEASLDLDFDVLITELSELNGLFQRMGRCYRNRVYAGKEPNVFVFIGENATQYPTYIVDKGLFRLSYKALENWQQGPIDEKTKMQLIDQTYTTQNVKVNAPDYYGSITKTEAYLAGIANDQKSKEEVDKLFREIDSQDVIPKSVYLENKGKIDDQYRILNPDYSDKKVDWRKKNKAIVALKDFLVPVTHFQFSALRKAGRIDEDTLGKGNFRYTIADTHYDDEKGLSIEKESKGDNFI